MNTYILEGGINQKENYIKDFVKINNIPEYYIYRYDEPLKIADVRELKKNIGLRPHGGHNRLFVIHNEPTLEAQNALLKTLEELSEENFFIFTNEELIDTVKSRCYRVRLGLSDEPIIENKQVIALLDSFVKSNDPGELLVFSENYFATSDKLDDLLVTARSMMISCLSKGDINKAFVLLKLLSWITDFNQEVALNNLNKRLVLDRIMLEKFAI